MTAAQPDAETRITRLEQRCARLSYALLATVALVATAVAWGVLRHPKTVVAQRYVLNDESGATRGEWGPSNVIAGEENGKPVLASTTCLNMASKKRSGVKLCSPWEEPGDAMLTLSHTTGTQTSLVAGPFTGQAIVTTAGAEERSPKNLALLIASPSDSGVTLRHGRAASSWTSAGAVGSAAASSQPAAR